MQGATFDTDTIRLMSLFEKTTRVGVKDCFEVDDGKTVYFVVEEGKVGSAIGKNGSNVKYISNMIKKDVKIIEYSEDLETFVKNMIPQANNVKITEEYENKIVEVRVESSQKPLVIGRGRKNINLFKELLRRSHNVNELMVR